MSNKSGSFTFVFLAFLLSVMAFATRFEHLHGSAKAAFHFYNSVWFTLLWILTATMGCYYIAVKQLHNRLSVFLLHISFLVILFGALTTRLTGKTGHVHLRENNRVEFFIDEATHSVVVSPFSISLKSFEIEYYPGTDSPSNYVSVVELTDAKTGEHIEHKISMNNILRYKGFRFYQSSFDDDMQGSILSVNRDTWGIVVTYAGYCLLFFSMLFILFDKRERFRFLLKKLAQKTMSIFVMLTTLGGVANASDITVAKDVSSRLGSICVDYRGRITPTQTLANDFTMKLTGKNRYNDLSGEQFFFGWLLFYENWRHEPMFELKSDELKRIAGKSDGYACLADFIDAHGSNKLEPYYRQMYGAGRTKGWINEAVKLNDKFHLIEMLQNGSLLKIFPMRSEDGKTQWYAPNTNISFQTDSAENTFIRHFFPLLREALIQGDKAAAYEYIAKLSIFQQNKSGDTLPSPTRLNLEKVYNRLQLFSLLFKICLALGGLGLIYFMFKVLKNNSDENLAVQRWSRVVLESCSFGIFILCTFGLVLRAIIGGRIPLSNTYETMLLLAWFSLLTGILMRRYSFLIVIFSLLLAGFTLLVAQFGFMNPQITPLAPVLLSPWLNVHVLTIMVAYGLCGFMTLNSLTAFILWIFGGKNENGKTDSIKRLKETSELLMYPATFLMGAGIFIGAIWANVSWGRYWGWDPKELWALVTFLLMGFTFHDKTLRWFRKPLFYHLFVIIIFLAVLMTYFGVNYLLGGKHSYAG